MKISLEFDSVDEWSQFINSFKDGREKVHKIDVHKPDEVIPKKVVVSNIKKAKIKVKLSAIERQIMKAANYALKNNVDFRKAVKRVCSRYATNWDYEIAERLGYSFRRKAKTIHEEEVEKNKFITKRTRILAETGWGYEEARKAAREAWDAGERDPDEVKQKE